MVTKSFVVGVVATTSNTIDLLGLTFITWIWLSTVKEQWFLQHLNKGDPCVAFRREPQHNGHKCSWLNCLETQLPSAQLPR